MTKYLIVDPEQAYRALVSSTDTLRPADRALLLEMLPLVHKERGVGLAQAVRDYYRDADRADRTPRQIAYMHLGFLSALMGAT